MTRPERATLAGILARLASPYEGERAAAALLASAFLARHELTWGDLTALLRLRPETPAAPDAPAPTHDRRRSGGGIRYRYCRRRVVPRGQVLNNVS